jgi:hypothetical protein
LPEPPVVTVIGIEEANDADRPGSWKTSHPEHTLPFGLLSHFRICTSMLIFDGPLRRLHFARSKKKQTRIPLTQLEFLGCLAAASRDPDVFRTIFSRCSTKSFEVESRCFLSSHMVRLEQPLRDHRTSREAGSSPATPLPDSWLRLRLATPASRAHTLNPVCKKGKTS